MHQQVDQGVDGEGSADTDVVQHALCVQIIPFSDGLDALWAEGVLGVDKEYLAFASSSRPGELGSHAQRMTELGLASPELPKGLRD